MFKIDTGEFRDQPWLVLFRGLGNSGLDIDIGIAPSRLIKVHKQRVALRVELIVTV